jgi:hypothetical protein
MKLSHVSGYFEDNDSLPINNLNDKIIVRDQVIAKTYAPGHMFAELM